MKENSELPQSESVVPLCRMAELARHILDIAREKDSGEGMMAGSTAIISVQRHASEILKLIRDCPFTEKLKAMEAELPQSDKECA